MPTNEAVAGGWTYERYLQLDDETRYEIIDGELLLTPAPGTRHQRVIRMASFRFSQFAEERGLGEVFFAPTDVVLSDQDVVQPDILFIRASRVAELVQDRAIHGAPDLVVEIISPTSSRRDRWQKRALYERSGIPEYWIVDPANRYVEVLSLGKAGYVLSSSAQGEGRVESRVLEGFTVAVQEIFPPAG